MKRLVIGIWICLLALGLGGCFLDPAENLYAVPEQPESFYDLQSAIRELISDGGTYSPPTSGEHQQAVHLTNLDADAEEEAIVYLKFSGDRPLSVCVFDRQEDHYVLAGRMDGAGYAFDSALYLAVDDVSGNEIVVGRKISEGVPHVLSVYSLGENGLLERMTTNYAEFITADLDGNGKRELISFYADGDVQNGMVAYFQWHDGEVVRDKETNLSAPVDAIKRIITGKLCQGVPAVFVGSTYGENMLVTDVFALKDGVFTNITPEDETGVATVREYYVYSCDIDDDGYIELPRVMPMQTLSEDPDSENQSMICWYNLQINGEMLESCRTYHNYAAGWFVEIPEKWYDRLAATRTEGLSGVQAYSFINAETGKELFAITACTERDMLYVQEMDWQALTQKGDVYYACRYNERMGLTQQGLREMFRFIRIDWNTGET